MTFSVLIPLLTAALAAPQASVEGAVVRGVVRSSVEDRPLEFAAVEVLGDQHVVAWTERDGSYVLTGLEPGLRTLRVTHTGHEALEVEVRVPADRDVVLDVTLEVKPVRLAPLHARTNRLLPGVDAPRPAEPIFGASVVRTLESTPGVAEIGLTDVVFGADGPPDASDVLYIRGSTSDLKLVMLDGAPIYAPFHLGGLLPAFAPQALASSKVLYGGAPARYDGGLAYILDLETRRGSRSFHTEGATDLVSSQALVEGGLGRRVTVLGVARGVHGEPTEGLYDQTFPYRYGDVLGRIDVDAGIGKHLTATAFHNEEGVEVGSVPGRSRIRWENTALSVRYGAPMGEDIQTRLGFSLGVFGGRLPVDGQQPIVATAEAGRIRLTGDFERRLEGVELAYGGSFEHIWLEYISEPQDAALPALLYTKVDGDAAAGYFDAVWQATPRLSFRGGVRADLYEITREVKVTPRAGVRYELSEDATMSLSAGRFHQYVRMPEMLVAGQRVGGTPELGPPDPMAPMFVGEASHYVAALDQVLSETLRLELDAYYRRFAPAPVTSRQAERDSADGGLESSGVDVWVRRAGHRVTGWMGYSLAWTWSSGYGSTADAILAGRHLLSAGVAGTLWDGSYLSVRVNYGAGLPLTSVPVDRQGETAGTPVLSSVDATEGLTAAALGTPDASYLRLDAEISHTFRGPRNRFSLTPYVRVLNALDRRDALFYRRDGETGAVEPLGDLPVIPVVGLAWRF